MLLGVVILCLIPLGRAGYYSYRQRQQQRALEELREIAGTEAAGPSEGFALPEAAGPSEGFALPEAAGSSEGFAPPEAAGPSEGFVPPEAAGLPGGFAPPGESGSVPEGEPGPGGERGTGEASNAPTPRPVMEKYRALYQENSDLVGWLSIEGTAINYPVTQREDDEYYLHHDFYGEDSRYGCLYVKNQADVDSPGTNFIIYGHNMKDGSMFGELDLYRKESFWREHPRISFDTLYEERTYEIIAVFRSRVYQPDQEVFKYYQFYQAEDQEEFSWFYENIKELSLYDTGVTAAFGDSFLTLSTCSYHVKDGRFVVVAKATAE